VRALDHEQVTPAWKERFANVVLLEQEQGVGGVLPQVRSPHRRQSLPQVLPGGATQLPVPDRVDRSELALECLAHAGVQAQALRRALDEAELPQALHGLRRGAWTQERREKRAARVTHDTCGLERRPHPGVCQVLKKQLSQARHHSRAVGSLEVEARALGGGGERELQRERVALGELHNPGHEGRRGRPALEQRARLGLVQRRQRAALHERLPARRRAPAGGGRMTPRKDHAHPRGQLRNEVCAQPRVEQPQ
jgi:hypothetical protein